jgi:hypothetical protein
MYTYIYVYMYIYVYVYIYMYMYTYTYIYVCVYIYMGVYERACVRVRECVRVRLSVCHISVYPAEYPRVPHSPRGYSRVPQSTLQSTFRVPSRAPRCVCAGVPQPHGARAPLRPARAALSAPRDARRHHRKVSTPFRTP